MCERLGIKIIAAGSPEAKGRVERNHGTHQDRLVKKLRRKRIATHAAVNEYLEQEYCDHHNQRFAIHSASEGAHHLPPPPAPRPPAISPPQTAPPPTNYRAPPHPH